MKKATTILLILFALTLSSCGGRKAPEINFGNQENSLFGKTYKDIADIPELREWELRGGSVISANKHEDGRFRFGFEEFNDTDGNIVLLLVEFVGEHDEGGRIGRKILDSVNIQKCNKGSDFLSVMCRVNEERDAEIVAVVFWEEREILRNVVRAWRANTNTGRFEVLDVEDIDCVNEGYFG